MNKILLALLLFLLPVCAWAADPTTGILDNFNRANGTLGASWGTAPDLKIISNTCGSNLTNGTFAINSWVTETYQDSEAYLNITAKPGIGQKVGISVRYNATTGASYYIEAQILAGTDNIHMSYWDGANDFSFGDYSQEISAGDAIFIKSVGTSINGSYKASGGSWVGILNGTNSSLSSANRLAIYTDSNQTRIDDLGGGKYIPPTNATIRQIGYDAIGASFFNDDNETFIGAYNTAATINGTLERLCAYTGNISGTMKVALYNATTNASRLTQSYTISAPSNFTWNCVSCRGENITVTNGANYYPAVGVALGGRGAYFTDGFMSGSNTFIVTPYASQMANPSGATTDYTGRVSVYAEYTRYPNAPYILTVGDSITNMAVGDADNNNITNFAWRDDLQGLFGIGNRQFVGRFRSPYSNTTYDVRTSAVFAENTTQQKAYFDADLDAYMPVPAPVHTAVLMHVGSNDALQGLNPTVGVNNILDMINLTHAHDANISVYVSTLIPMNTSDNSSVMNFNLNLTPAIATRQATKTNLYLVNCSGAFLNNSNWKTEYMSADGEHPTDAGNAVIAQEFYNAIYAAENPAAPASTDRHRIIVVQ